jgi:GH15 family glucan-1,4-alpha-glucosidase
MGYQPIEHYGVVGDLRTVALIGMDGSVDFMCFPRFDSPAVFCALLDDRRGGRFAIQPVLGDAQPRQLYLPDSNVLLTRFLSEYGVAEISDFMPVREAAGVRALVRRVKAIRGDIRFRLVCAPRFDYARAHHRVEARGCEAVFIPDGAHPRLRLRSDVPLEVRDGTAAAEFLLRAGDAAAFVLEDASLGPDRPTASPAYVSEAFKRTLNFWRGWTGRSSYHGRWREMVYRSDLVLRLLVSDPHSAPVAAATFGLPERVGGERNWDYRYTWIRDASFTLSTLVQAGHRIDDADAFLRWIEARCHEAGGPQPLQPLYRVDGGANLDEETLRDLEGYRGSVPVRIGNSAYAQRQLDLYGELLDAVWIFHRHRARISGDLWAALRRMVDWVCAHWAEPDEGIWEVRGGPQEFLYSRLMCWVALDRALRLATGDGLPADADRWRRVRADIARDIHERFWDPRRRAFVQSKGSTAMGAATLRMPLVGFISATDPRWRSTLRAIEEDLIDDSLVHRYRVEQSPDGLTGHEGAFCICSFWYVQCLARAGDLEQARLIFEKMLGYANHLGLYAEQLGPRGEHLGNFPQAFTHLALISAAYDLNRRLDAAGRGDAAPVSPAPPR